MGLDSKLSRHLVVGSIIFAIFASYLSQAKLGRSGDSTANQKSSTLAVKRAARSYHTATKTIAVCGSTRDGEEHPFADKIAELIAVAGYNLVTSGQGGNIDKIRASFRAYKKGDDQKSIWAPSTRDKANHDNPMYVDETLEAFDGDNPEADDFKLQITKADMVLVLPGGPGTATEVEVANKRKKPCFGVLTNDNDLRTDGAPVSKVAKDALTKFGFKYVNDVDPKLATYDSKRGKGSPAFEESWKKDSKAISDFFAGNTATTSTTKDADKPKSDALHIFSGSAFAIVMLGLFAVQ
jgi:ketosteroid isomerase-like protein